MGVHSRPPGPIKIGTGLPLESKEVVDIVDESEA